MTKDQIIASFKRLSHHLSVKDVRAEIGVVGGAAMVLAYDARSATKDVDAIFKPSSEVREASRAVADEMNLSQDWLNDAVKGFLPGNPKERETVFEEMSLLVWVPETEYLLAMKALAARLDTNDSKDLRFLIKEAQVKTAEEVFDIVQKYYPRREVPAKTKFFVEELFESGLASFVDGYGIPLNEERVNGATRIRKPSE